MGNKLKIIVKSCDALDKYKYNRCGICYVTMCPDQRIYNSFFDQSLTVSLAYDYRELSLSSLGKRDMHGKKSISE